MNDLFSTYSIGCSKEESTKKSRIYFTSFALDKELPSIKKQLPNEALLIYVLELNVLTQWRNFTSGTPTHNAHNL